VFIGVLGQKQVEKQVFGSKEYKPRFSGHRSGQIRKNRRRVGYFFFQKKGGRHIVHPRCRIKKRAQSYGLATCLGSPVVGPGERG